MIFHLLEHLNQLCLKMFNRNGYILSQITISEKIKNLDYNFLKQNLRSILGLKNFQITN